MLNIRKAVPEDLEKIMEIYRTAQDYMIANGNAGQWGRNYPPQVKIEEDIDLGKCLLVCEAGPGADEIRGVFAAYTGDEPTYQIIEDGEWLNDEPYVTVHRVASDGKAHGVFACIIEYLKEMHDNIRIDTHEDNKTMQRQILKNGFARCGIIYVRDRSPRIAFQWAKSGEAAD